MSRATAFFSGLSSPANGVVIVNFPTNGYDGYSINEIMTCLQSIYNATVNAGHKCYITTTQPRTDGNFSSSAVKLKLAQIKDSVIARFGANSINFWDGMYNPADTSILAMYSAGDNVHLNNDGHRVLFERVMARNIFNISTNDYRSNVNPAGLWSSASSWQVFNGSAWVTASVAPDSTAGNIHILGGDSITVSATANMDQVNIHTNGKLAVFNTGTTFTATLANGTGTDLQNSGRLYISVNATLNGTGTIVNNSDGLMVLRNQGTLRTNTTNNGLVNVSGTGNIRNTSFTNNKTFVLIDFTLNINNTIFTNNDSFAVLYNSASYIATTVASDSGTFINTTTGILYRSNTAGSTTINGQVKFYNYGTMKGYGEYIVYNAVANSGIIDPGNYSAGILTVNPAFITGKSPTLLLQVYSNGGTAGIHYDQVKFSAINTLVTNVSNTSLHFIDNASEGAFTTYTLISIAGLQVIGGTFQEIYKPSNFNNVSYNLLSVSIMKSATGKNWDGGAGTANWGDAANWNPDGVPSSGDNAVIAAGTAVNINVNATCKDLTLNNTNLAVTILSGYSLTVNGMLTAQLGNININGQSLVLNGTMLSQGSGGINGSSASSITIGGTGGGNFGTLKMNANPDNILGNLTMARNGTSGAATLGNNGVQLSGTLTLSNGVLATGGNLVLLSTRTGTARIAPVTNGSLSGEITVQRFIPGGADRRRFRFLASPVENVTLANSWQQSIHITGAGTGGTVCPSLTSHTNGFDPTPSLSPSVYTYSETTNSWSSVPNTNATNLIAGKGFRVFVRGNRSDGCNLLTSMPTATSDVTLSAKGTIVTGTRSISLTKTGNNGWNLVGNPYASAIDWNNSAWQAAMPAAIGRTIYTYNPVTNSYASWHPVAGGINGGSSIIASGQSFFVTVNGAATLQIEEAYKSTGMTNGLFGKSAGIARLRIQLADTAVRDEMIAYTYPGATNSYDNALDGKKCDFTTNRIASFTIADSTRLAFNAFAPDTAILGTDTLPLITGLAANSNYNLNLTGIPGFSRKIMLFDKYTSSAIVLKNDTVYSFITNSDPASTNNYRFYLIFFNSWSVSAGINLPVTLASFSAEKRDDKTWLKWTTLSEQNNSYFTIERSTDNISFIEIGKVKSQASNTNSQLSYTFTDETPAAGITNYYRLRQTDFDLKTELSTVVAVNFETQPTLGNHLTTSVYPNPAVNNTPLNLALGKVQQLVVLTLYRPDGEIVLKRSLTNIQSATLEKGFTDLKPGVYYLEVQTTDGKEIHKVLK